METKKSKVIIAVQTREYTGRNGQIFCHSITFENGDVGEYGSQKQQQTKFVVGQEAEYTITPNSNPAFAAKVKPVYAPQQGGPGVWKQGERRPTNNRSFALAYAKDIAVAMIRSGKPMEDFGGTNGIIAIAAKFNIFLENKTPNL